MPAPTPDNLTFGGGKYSPSGGGIGGGRVSGSAPRVPNNFSPKPRSYRPSTPSSPGRGGRSSQQSKPNQAFSGSNRPTNQGSYPQPKTPKGFTPSPAPKPKNPQGFSPPKSPPRPKPQGFAPQPKPKTPNPTPKPPQTDPNKPTNSPSQPDSPASNPASPRTIPKPNPPSGYRPPTPHFPPLYPPSSEEIQPPNVPFNGGQQPGVVYYAVGTYKNQNTNRDWYGQTMAFSTRADAGIIGPILSATQSKNVGTASIDFVTRDYGLRPRMPRGGPAGGSPVNYTANPVNSIDEYGNNLVVTQYLREDGKPDTGGNPPGTEPPITSTPPPPLFLGVGAEGTPNNDFGTPPAPLSFPSPAPAPTTSTSPTPTPTFAPAGAPAPSTAPNAAPAPAPAPETLGNNPATPLWTTPNPFEYSPAALTALGFSPAATSTTTSRSPTSTQFMPTRVPTPTRAPAEQFRPTPNNPPRPVDFPNNNPTPRPNTTPQPPRTTPPPSPCETANACVTGRLDTIRQGQNNQGNLLAGINALLSGLDFGLLAVINAKLGAQLPNGISGFMQTAWKSMRINKILDALNTLLLLHNAAMLSRNLGSTLGELLSQGLSVIGIKDENDNPLDVNAELGRQTDNFFKTILGEEVWKGTKLAWNKASSIISSASNVLWTVRSIFDSAREIGEWTAENTGKIGNALKRWGIVGENAYSWMPERVTTANRWTQRIDRFREGTENLEDAASSLQGVLGEVQSIQEEAGQLREQHESFKKQLEDLPPKERPDNKPVKTQTDESKAASNSPAIKDLDTEADENDTP